MTALAEGVLSLPKAWEMISAAPAQILRLADRGRLDAAGLAAHLDALRALPGVGAYTAAAVARQRTCRPRRREWEDCFIRASAGCPASGGVERPMRQCAAPAWPVQRRRFGRGGRP